MPVTVHAARMLVGYLGIPPDFSVEAKTLEELLDKVDRQHKGFRDSICDETGRIRTYVNVFVNEENIGEVAHPLSSLLKDGDEVFILANIAGGKG